MTQPLVSIIMPVYNEEAFIKDALASIVGQTYGNYELIIVDDGSYDNTRAIVNPYLGGKVKLIKMWENMGKGVCLNWGLAAVKGKYVLEMDGDDWLERDALEALVQEAEKLSDEIAYLYTDRNVFYQEKTGLPRFHHVSKGIPFIDRYQFLSTLRAYGPRFLRTEALRSIGGWPVDYPSGGRLFEDFVLVLRLLDRYHFAYLPKRIYNVRRHWENISKVNKKLWWPICRTVVDEALERWGGEYKAKIADKRSRFRLRKTAGQTR